MCGMNKIHHTQKMLQLLDKANTALADWAQELRSQAGVTPKMLREFDEYRDQVLEVYDARQCKECDEIVEWDDWNKDFDCCEECGEKAELKVKDEIDTRRDLKVWLEKQ
jgi:hypothetical protein